jgi:hypothetical protein
VQLIDAVPLSGALVALFGVTLDDGTVQEHAAPLPRSSAVVDALDDPAFGRALLDVMAGEVAAAARSPARSGPRRGGSGPSARTSGATGPRRAMPPFCPRPTPAP